MFSSLSERTNPKVSTFFGQNHFLTFTAKPDRLGHPWQRWPPLHNKIHWRWLPSPFARQEAFGCGLWYVFVEACAIWCSIVDQDPDGPWVTNTFSVATGPHGRKFWAFLAAGSTRPSFSDGGGTRLHATWPKLLADWRVFVVRSCAHPLKSWNPLQKVNI